MERVALTEFATADSMFASAHDAVLEALTKGLSVRRRASLFCAGGSTPAPLYKRLAEAELDWQYVTVGLTDERWVDHQSPGSNEAFLRRTLLSPGSKAANARFLPMVTDPYADAFAESVHVAAYYNVPALMADCLIVGMGSDAHTLSWFAGARGLAAATDPTNRSSVAAIHATKSDVTGEFTQRVTLTGGAVSRARLVLLLITGDEKRRVYETARPDSPIATLAACAETRLKAFWSP